MSKKRRQHNPELKAKVSLEALKGIEPIHALAANCGDRHHLPASAGAVVRGGERPRWSRGPARVASCRPETDDADRASIGEP